MHTYWQYRYLKVRRAGNPSTGRAGTPTSTVPRLVHIVLVGIIVSGYFRPVP